MGVAGHGKGSQGGCALSRLIAYIGQTVYYKSMSKQKPITVEAAAKFLNVTSDHVSALIRRGKIKAEMFSRVWLVDPVSVRRYLRMDRMTTKGRPRKES